jgi:HK97 family phage major capsid protein
MEKLREELTRALTPAKAIAEKAEAENRDLSAEEREQITAAISAASGIKSRIDQSKADSDLTAQLSGLGEGIGVLPTLDRDRPGDGDALWTPRKGQTLGSAFAQSPQLKALLKAYPNGRIPERAVVNSQPFGAKALITGLSDTSAGAFVVNDEQGLKVGLDAFQRPLTIRQLVTNGTTDSDTVEYVRVTSTTNAASPVAESTTTADPGSMVAANGVKPESAMAMAKVTETVKTIAHWLPATTRALSDAGQVRTLIDSFLRYGLEEELEDQMINGAGTGENFTGIGTVSGTQSQAWDTNILTTTRKARTLVRTVGRSIPTAYVLNPADWETIDLLQDNENRYYFGGPTRLGQPTLWGLPVVESEAVPAGVGYVGDWRKAALWDRQQASITVSNSHANFFIRNMVAILAEMRAAFGVLQPNAFVEIDLTA